MTKKLLLHFEFMKKALEHDPKSVMALAEEMKKEFGVNYHYVYQEVKELISLKKIKEIRHNNETLLLWTKIELTFEHELSTNIVRLDKQYMQFSTKPSKVRQMKLPLYVIGELVKKIADLSEDMELMLALTAVKSNGVWYKVEKR